MRYFYVDLISAALMHKNFGMTFYDKEFNRPIIFAFDDNSVHAFVDLDIRKCRVKAGQRFYIDQDSLQLLKPKDWDIVINHDLVSYKPTSYERRVGFYAVWMAQCAEICIFQRIVERNDVPFIWPEVET